MIYIFLVRFISGREFFFAVIYKKVSWFCDGRDDSRRNLQNVGRRQI